jgi:Gas vesicle synthesis protein GvpL/GvpF
MSEQEQNLWVYGVLPAGAELRELARREDLPEVSLIELDDLAVLVGPGAEEDGISQQALWYAQVLQAAVLDAPVIPIALGTVVEDEDAVSEQLLRAHHDGLQRYLQALSPYVQMTLKVFYEQDVLLREIVDSEPRIAALSERTQHAGEVDGREDRVRLGELVSAAVERQRAQDSELILSRLRSAAARFANEELEEDFMVVNSPCLVARDGLDEFEAAVDELASERLGRLRFVLYGPMPAYSFLDLQEPAWA